MKLNQVDIISSRLRTAFSPVYLEVKDESDQHIGHAGHERGGRHFAIVIAAPCFDGMSRVDVHRKIYALFQDMMPHAIHALKISVISR